MFSTEFSNSSRGGMNHVGDEEHGIRDKINDKSVRERTYNGTSDDRKRHRAVS